MRSALPLSALCVLLALSWAGALFNQAQAQSRWLAHPISEVSDAH